MFGSRPDEDTCAEGAGARRDRVSLRRPGHCRRPRGRLASRAGGTCRRVGACGGRRAASTRLLLWTRRCRLRLRCACLLHGVCGWNPPLCRPLSRNRVVSGSVRRDVDQGDRGEYQDGRDEEEGSRWGAARSAVRELRRVLRSGDSCGRADLVVQRLCAGSIGKDLLRRTRRRRRGRTLSSAFGDRGKSFSTRIRKPLAGVTREVRVDERELRTDRFACEAADRIFRRNRVVRSLHPQRQ
jgi:hypothetical protein